MRQRRKIVFILLGVFLIAAILSSIFPLKSEREPTYGGKTLSTWVILLGKTPYRDPKLEEAITAIGTNALPYLLEWIQYLPPFGKEEAVHMANKVSFKLRGEIPFHDQAKYRATGVPTAFEILGPSAKAAVDELGRMANGPVATNSQTSIIAVRAVLSLRPLGPESVPYLVRMLTNEQIRVRHCAAEALGQMGTNAYTTIPVLIQSLQSTDVALQCEAVEALGNLRSDSIHVIPALVSSLNTTNLLVRLLTAEALAKYDQKSLAIPVIRAMLVDPSPAVRELAEEALLKIDPEALKRATQ